MQTSQDMRIMRSTQYTSCPNQSSNGLFLSTPLGSLDVLYSINLVGGLTRVIEIDRSKLATLTVPDHDMQFFLNHLLSINNAYKESLCAIGKKLGWQQPTNTNQLLDIKAWTIKEDLSQMTVLDLKNLGLEEIPPQLFQLVPRLETLDLSGNKLRLLPPELQYSHETLRELNISENVRLQPNIPEYLWDFKDLHLIAYGMGEIFPSKGKGNVMITSSVMTERYHRQE